MSENARKKILIVVGEPSGDSHAAHLVDALRRGSDGGDLEFFGSTGPMLRERGVETVVSADEFAIIGLPEVIRALPMFLRARGKILKAVQERKPDIAVLVDFPEFNLKIARALKRRGVKVVYYISPQLWAWRRYRIRTIKKHVDRLISILPFEGGWYRARGVGHVRFVGNPTVSELKSPVPRGEFCRRTGLDSERPIVALLPGSRLKEVVRILPTMLLAARRMRDRMEGLQFVIAMAAARNKGDVTESFRRAGIEEGYFGPDLRIVFGETVDAVGGADAAAVASGTATLETAVIGTPLVIVYRSTAINYALLSPLVDVKHIGLINLIAGRRLAPELLQGEFTEERLSDELLGILGEERNARMRAELEDATAELRRGSASENAARVVEEVLFGETR